MIAREWFSSEWFSREWWLSREWLEWWLVGVVGCVLYKLQAVLVVVAGGGGVQMTAVLVSKLLCCAVVLCTAGLHRQCAAYSAIQNNNDSTSYNSFVILYLCCALWLAGVLESLCSAVCVWQLQLLRSRFALFTGLQMFQQLPEAVALYSCTALLLPYSALPLIVAQQSFVLRLMLGGGLGKLMGAPNRWSDLSAMSYHYWTTPLPNPLSPHFHRLPLIIHRLEVAATLLIEGPLGAALQLLPFVHARRAACALYVSLLAAINLTGNYGHLGLLSVAQCASLLDDAFIESIGLGRLLRATTAWTYVLTPSVVASTRWFAVPILSCVCFPPVFLYIAASIVPFVSTFSQSHPKILSAAWPMLLKVRRGLTPYLGLGRYVKFAGMTTTRHEVIIQLIDRDGGIYDWPNKYKPTGLSSSLPVVPFIPGVDWFLWFVGLRWRAEVDPWVFDFMRLLLHGNRDVMGLMGPCPIAIGDAVAIQASVYDYRYAFEQGIDFPEKGTVWQRKFLSTVAKLKRETRKETDTRKETTQ